MKSAGLPKIEMAGRNLSVPYAPPGAKRIDDDDFFCTLPTMLPPCCNILGESRRDLF